MHKAETIDIILALVEYTGAGERQTMKKTNKTQQKQKEEFVLLKET